MGFLTPKIPEIEPPPVPPARVVKENKMQDRVRARLKDEDRVSRRRTRLTGARGVMSEAPLSYSTLLGSR